MTRRPKSVSKKQGGGLLMGMRSGVQHLAGEGGAHEAPKSERRKLLWNILTVVLVLVTAAVLLRRFHVIDF